MAETELELKHIGADGQRCELVFAFVGALGTDLESVAKYLQEELTHYGYQTFQISISQDIIKDIAKIDDAQLSPFDKAKKYMNAGDILREKAGETGDNSILSFGVAASISAIREEVAKKSEQNAYLIRSIKTPKEVAVLRTIYGNAFFLIGVSCEPDRRLSFLIEHRGMNALQATKLIERDYKGNAAFGQDVSGTFHLSDFFVYLSRDTVVVRQQVQRLLSIVFGSPSVTPTFDEYAMYLAFAASLRSGDLSRQVGAVVTQRQDILSTGANDVPRFGGGLYWERDQVHGDCESDVEDGRDYARGFDNNKREQAKIIDQIVSKFGHELSKVTKAESSLDEARSLLVKSLTTILEKESGVKHLIEYMRAVHAEMEAILACTRNGLSTLGGRLFCTTFPCHECAKHIIAAGIHEVVYVEPYPKSRAAVFHEDALKVDPSIEVQGRVVFRSFVGVGPRRFFDLFSMRFGSGRPTERKDSTGSARFFNMNGAVPKLQAIVTSYRELELKACGRFAEEYDAWQKVDWNKAISELKDGLSEWGEAGNPSQSDQLTNKESSTEADNTKGR